MDAVLIEIFKKHPHYIRNITMIYDQYGKKQSQQVYQIHLLIENNRREGQITFQLRRFEKIEIGEVEPNFGRISKRRIALKIHQNR